MKINKLNKILLAAVSLLLSISTILFAEIPEYDIQTEAIAEFRTDRPKAGWYNENYIIVNGSNSIGINLENNEIMEFDEFENVAYVMGIKEDKFIISRANPAKDIRSNFFEYDPVNKDFMPFNEVPVQLHPFDVLNRIFDYKDNQYIASYSITDRGGTFYNTYLIDSLTGEFKMLKEYGKVYDISPDGMHLLIMNYDSDYIGVYNLLEKKVTSKLNYNGNSGFEYNCFFKTNDLILFVLPGIGNEYGKAKVYDIKLKEVAEYHYYPPKTMEKPVNMYTRINNSEYAYLPNDITKNRVLVKAFGENEALNSLGLLFHPTTAIVNDDRVRMREWPLLDAKHIAFLEQGEEVKVMERSGIKVKIDDMADYWYKIKRSDGIEGWTYGYFLDLAEEE